MPLIVWRESADPDVYETARTNRLFNGVIPQRYPAAIAFAKSEQDIVDAVNTAVQKNHRVSVRAGGHSYAAWSLRSDALLIDLGQFVEMNLDESSGIVRASPGVTGAQLNTYLSARGRAFPVGHCPDVALGGFLLGGGMGWNSNNWGWACESIVAIDLVTASGEHIRADECNSADLFWAARGGGPAFPGVVTRFHLQTQPAPKAIRSSVYVYPGEHYKAAFTWILKTASSVDHLVEITAVGSYKEGVQDACLTIILVAFGDDEHAVGDILQKVDQSRPAGLLSRSFSEQTSIDRELENKYEAYPIGQRYNVDNVFLKNDADVAELLRPAFTTLPTRQSLALWSSMRPRSTRALADMALSVQSDHYFALYAIWENEADDLENGAWLAGVMNQVQRQAAGAYLGEHDFKARAARLWGSQQYERLVGVKRKWDPDHRICGCLGLGELD
ncbi:unnamed protein product [Clonostachys rhizophaga]|uniref:FAD-binding PCMH-type domain-containing protein n=1 Tax=Clonostachys rhizophaga TaxID=160324 RepID=A0A9N9VV59_9HYPO|nr:unnamed protein product [Clonostachys rhizophaga]